MRVAAKNKTEYLAAAGDRKPALVALDKLIRKSAPGLAPYFMSSETMSGLAYGRYRYKYASGRETDWCTIGVMNQKNYISLYVCVVKNGKYLAEVYGKRLGKASCGKSCIRFKKLEDLDLDVVAELLTEAGKLAKDQASLQM